jgi:hypothetical protein
MKNIRWQYLQQTTIPRIRLLVADIDGTLVTKDKLLTPKIGIKDRYKRSRGNAMPKNQFHRNGTRDTGRRYA